MLINHLQIGSERYAGLCLLPTIIVVFFPAWVTFDTGGFLAVSTFSPSVFRALVFVGSAVIEFVLI